MEFEKLMQKLIDSTVPYIVEGTPEEKAEMAINLEKRLRKTYKEDVEDAIKTNDERLLNFFIEKIKEYWNEKSLEEKKRELLIDKVYEEIVSASNTALEIAGKRNKEGIICEDKDLYDKLSNILLEKDPNVKEFNKNIIKTYISEGILDLNYAFGYSDAMSLRIGRWNKK